MSYFHFHKASSWYRNFFRVQILCKKKFNNGIHILTRYFMFHFILIPLIKTNLNSVPFKWKIERLVTGNWQLDGQCFFLDFVYVLCFFSILNNKCESKTWSIVEDTTKHRLQNAYKKTETKGLTPYFPTGYIYCAFGMHV